MRNVILKIKYIVLVMFFVIANGIIHKVTSQTSINDTINTRKENSFKKPIITGNFYTQFRKNFNDIGSQNRASAYFDYSFSPIILWKLSNRFFIECELEAASERGKSHIKLGYADISFTLNKYITIVAGNFLTPLGTYQERLHPMWINKFPDIPIGFGHDDLLPVTENGINVRGGFGVLKSKLNYALFVSNGPALSDGDHIPKTEGKLLYENEEDTSVFGFLNFNNYRDNNFNKAIGGRIGILPFYNSSLEVGVWVESAIVGEKYDEHSDTSTSHIDAPDYSNVRSTLYGFDFSYMKNVAFLKGVIDIKGQWNTIKTGDAQYLNKYDTSGVVLLYYFNNKSIDFYTQCAYRLLSFDNNILNKSEICLRYSYIKTPKGSMWESDIKQFTIGINYWLNWHSVFKLALQTENGTREKQVLFFQWAMGF